MRSRRSRRLALAIPGLAILLLIPIAAWPASAPGLCASSELPKPLARHPDAGTAGVPPDMGLTRVRGDYHTIRDGQVIDRLQISGNLYIDHDNVTVKCSRVWGMTTNDGKNLRMWLSTLGDPEGRTNGSALKYSDYTLRRVEIMGMVDGLKAEGNVDVRDSYIHDLFRTRDESQDNGWTHNDGVQMDSGSDMVFKHNTFLMWSFTDGQRAGANLYKTPYGNGDGYSTSAFMITMRRPAERILIQDNLIRGRTSDYIFVLRASSNVEIVDNVLGKENRDYPDVFTVTEGTVVRGNVFVDGTPARR